MFKAMVLVGVFFAAFILSVVMSKGRHGLLEYFVSAAIVTFIAWCFMSLVPTDL